MYQVKVNDKLNFEVKRDKGTLTVNGENTEADVSQLGALQYHVIHNMASYNVEVISQDKATKTAELTKVRSGTSEEVMTMASLGGGHEGARGLLG